MFNCYKQRRIYASAHRKALIDQSGYLKGAADLGEVGQQVFAERVGDVLRQALDGAIAGHDRGTARSEERHHCKTPVLDLLRAHLGHVALPLVEQVEEAARVRRFARTTQHLLEANEVLLTHRARVPVVGSAAQLGNVHQSSVDPENGLRAGPVLVRALRRNHTRLEKDEASFRRDQPELTEKFRGYDAGNTEHRPAAVDDLRVRQPLRVDETTSAFRIGQAERVKAVIARQRAVEVAQALIRVPENIKRREISGVASLL